MFDHKCADVFTSEGMTKGWQKAAAGLFTRVHESYDMQLPYVRNARITLKKREEGGISRRRLRSKRCKMGLTGGRVCCVAISSFVDTKREPSCPPEEPKIILTRAR